MAVVHGQLEQKYPTTELAEYTEDQKWNTHLR